MSHLCYIGGMNESSDANNKDLLAELLGEGGKVSGADVELPDGPLPAVPDPTAELEVKPEARPSAIQAADAVHATDQGGEGFALTIAGQAYTKDERGNKAEVPYKVTINVTKLEGAMSLLRKIPKNGGDSFLDAVVRKVIGPTFRGVRTYNPVGAVPRNPSKTAAPTNLQFMTIEQLRVVVKERKAPIKLADYGEDVVALREAVMDFFLNPKGFAEREAKRSADIVERRELEAANS